MRTNNVPFSKITRKRKSPSFANFSRGLMNEFEVAVINETSVFGPQKVYSKINKQRSRIFGLMDASCVSNDLCKNA